MQRFTGTERVFSLFTSLRAGEGQGAVRLAVQSFTIMFAYYLLKVIREPMILAEGSAELKAYSTALQAVLLMVIVPLFAGLYRRLGSREGKHRLLARTLLFFIGNLALLALAVDAGLPVAIVFYVWLGIFSVMSLSLFWAFAADLYNLKSGRRLFPLIAAAAALGALAGAGLAEWISQHLGFGGVMWVAAGILLVPWRMCRATETTIPEGSRAVSADGEAQSPRAWLEGFHIVYSSRYLSLIALFVILLNLINSNGEYILAKLLTAHVQAIYPDGGVEVEQSLTSFYAGYFFITTALGFFIQLLLVPRIFNWLGISGALQILPLLMIASYSLLALLPVLAIARVVMVAENSLNYSLQFTTRNALYLPLERRQKYVGKHTIETFFFRLGDVISGGLVYLASIVLGLPVVIFMIANALLAAFLWQVTRKIGAGHDRHAAETQGNMPPVAMTELADVSVRCGRKTRFQLDADTFVDPDVGDALRYRALLASGELLPAWLKFDGLDRSFTLTPPSGSEGSLHVKVVARDFDGLEAEACFVIHYQD